MTASEPWVVLVVDDEPQVRDITRIVLANFRFEGRRLQLLDAGSAREAREILARRNDVALILLDVVMETEHAGLDLVRHVRGELRNRLVRIVLRTGHPGQAPEREVIRDYDINDYKEKTELTALQLEVAVLVALRGYRDLMEVETARAGLAGLQASIEDLARSERLQRALFAISDLSGSNLEMHELLSGIHANVGTLMYAENFFIVLYDDAADSFRYLYFADVEDQEGEDPERLIAMSSRERSLTWHLLRGGKPLMGNVERIRGQVSGALRSLGPPAKDWLGVPMVRDGRVQGGIVVQSYRDDVSYSDEDRAVLEFVAHHILTALERKQRNDELERRVAERTRELRQEVEDRQRSERLQAALFRIAQLATADISQTEFYRRVHAVVGDLIDAKNFYIAMLSGDRSALEFAYFVDETEQAHPSRPLGAGLSELVLREGRALLDRDRIEALVAQGRIDPGISGAAPACWLGVPLHVDEQAIGLIVVQNYDASVAYGAVEQELLGFVASQVANSLQRRRSAETLQRAYAELEQRVADRTRDLRREIEERARVQQQLTHQVMHDGLTGLPNRGFLRDRLERVLSLLQRDTGRRCALLFIDVDRFKVINDSLGHLVGDEVLKEVAQRLLACVRTPDVVARLSGDEFAILIEDAPEPSTALKVAQRVISQMARPMLQGENELVFSASIGVAIGDARCRSADQILRDADAAMYRAKQQGRARFELFDESMQQAAIDVLRLEGELRTALQQDQFEPYLQPITGLADGRVRGYEALIRWNHPARGVLTPGAFLQVAEDSGSMDAIDWRMYELSCLRARPLVADGMHLTINVAPRHFRKPDFAARLLDLLERTRFPPRWLQIEITEGSLIEHPGEVRTTLQQLLESGIGASLDDFGTGYSSLSYLHTFPLQVLKIDRAFVAGLGRDENKASVSVVAAVLALARSLDMAVVAEGVETDEQRRALMALGCDVGQGYLLGRPFPAAHWLEMGAGPVAGPPVAPMERHGRSRDGTPGQP